MEKLIYTLYFLPSIVCLLWTIALMMTEKTARQKTLMGCLSVGTIYFTTYAMYCIPGFDYEVIAVVESVSLPMSIITLGLIVCYLTLLITKGSMKTYYMLWLVPGLMYAASLTTLFVIVGYENAGKFFSIHPEANYALWPRQYDIPLYHVFQFVDYYMSSYLGLSFFLLIIGLCVYILYKDGYRPGDIMKFILEKKRSTPIRVIAISIIILMILLAPISIDYHNVASNTTLSVILALGIALEIHIICFSEYNSHLKAFTYNNLRKAKLYDDLMEQRNKEEKEREEAEKKRIAAAMERDSNLSAIVEQRRKSLMLRFRKLMEEDHLYLRDDITAADVSRELGVGRTVLSAFISQRYDSNFRGVINKYRIKHAKEYMLHHPTATQETVALASGFKDAVSYSHKFKELTGVSPAVWAVSEAKRDV